ncbi:MAG: hypothetical protein IPO66_06040 [Rhodanobacteraceae bacterium]|nr:hypothetical protein [Rhodanobacteraceae bacterium]
MNTIKRSAISAALVLALFASQGIAQQLTWSVGVNNSDIAPGGAPAATFKSYNQPAINNAGVLVFRARSSEGSAQQVDGIYQRNLVPPGPIIKLLTRGDAVPSPNNTLYTGIPAGFMEFPSTPRIDATSNLVATRGQHQPTWTYMLGTTETRIGTSGIYAFPAGVPVTGASLLGSAVELDQFTLSFPWFSVPGALLGQRFDQFPGSAAVADGRYIVYKGNYTDLADGLGRTGIYFRDVVTTMPIPYTGLVASSNTLIPNQPAGGTTTFGSTAPPSAANGFVYFTGLDIEEAPTMGGIYRAPIASTPPLQVVVSIGGQVPGEAAGVVFRTMGEALSLNADGSRMAFWASWGTEMFQKTLLCPVDGNPDIIAYCNLIHPTGLVVNVPVNQGFFVYDLNSNTTHRVARTLEDGVEDFMFWGFSGRAPGAGGTIEPGTELARWRAGTFAALHSPPGSRGQVVFKAKRNALDGLYMRDGVVNGSPLQTVAEVSTTNGTLIDPLAPAGSFVSAVGIERDGFRGGRLAVTLSMLWVDPVDPENTLGWAGIYVAPYDEDALFRNGFEG